MKSGPLGRSICVPVVVGAKRLPRGVPAVEEL